tara:strand:- start:983 stop:1819 length:837 start_codon:yes stop_codon:yes gene_type:complete
MAVGSTEVTAPSALSDQAIQAIESRLMALQRSQAEQDLPVPLPTNDFWNLISQLTQSIEIEMDECIRKEGWGAKIQLLQKRQNNIRWAIGSITQHRLNAFVRHANMRTLLSQGNSSDIAEPNWDQHAPSERAFYEGACRLIEKFQKEIDWEQMRNGIGESTVTPNSIQGIAPLTEFIASEDADRTTIEEMDEQIPPPDVHLDEGWEDENQYGHEVTQENQSAKIDDDCLMIRFIKDVEQPVIDFDGNEVQPLVGDVFTFPDIVAKAMIKMGYAENTSI